MVDLENIFSDSTEVDSHPEAVNDLSDLAQRAVKSYGGSDSLSADDSNWLESLFEKIFGPLFDLFSLDLPKDSKSDKFDPKEYFHIDNDVLDVLPFEPVDTVEVEDGVETETITFEPGNDIFNPADEGTNEGYRIEEAADLWHWQETDHTCAVCSQEFIINEFLDMHITEAELAEIAEANGWLAEDGTMPQDVGNLLEYFGIDTERHWDGTYEDLKETLDRGGRAVVGVDAWVLWTEGTDNYPLYGANHAIEVIGIDDSDPNDIKIIVNDSGEPEGRAKAYPYDEFMEAWAGSGGFIVSAFPNT